MSAAIGESFLIGLTVVGVLYGGGQIPSANLITGKLIEKLLAIPNMAVYGINKSYMGLAERECYERFDISKAREIQTQLGTYLETCRKVVPSQDIWFNKIIETLTTFNIHALFITGGDGSAKGALDFASRCKTIGYPMRIVFVPCTIDGIGGSCSLGINSAVTRSIKTLECMMANAFATYDFGLAGSRIVVLELQGRNRNDILVAVMKWFAKQTKIGKYIISDIDMICLPAGHSWSVTELIRTVLVSSKKTVIVAAEGAMDAVEEDWFKQVQGNGVGEKIANLINLPEYNYGKLKRKANYTAVGYLSQTNDDISKREKEKIDLLALLASQTLGLSGEESMAIAMEEDDIMKWVPLKYIVEQNPNMTKANPLTEEELKLLEPYM